jgi:hypothetical protein
MQLPDIFETFNRRIYTFVNQPENQRLIPATGSYSTPFRGTLRGETEGARATSQLATGGVGVLWLGANPNVPESLEKVLDPDSRNPSHFPSFERQMQSGRVGAQQWDEEGVPRVGWDPIGAPVRGWALYADVVKGIAGDGGVAMANFLPWGSALARDFWTPMKASHPELLARVLRFANDLNLEITQALRPKLIVVPKSLGGSRELADTWIASSRAIDARLHELPLTKRRFKFTTAQIDGRGATWPVAYVPHPASLQYNGEDRAKIREGLSTALKLCIV